MSSGRAASTRFQKMNRPPDSEPWVWFTREMLESEAWGAMTLAARRIIERVALEHMAHGGKRNGELIVTYDDFHAFDIRRKSIPQGIAVAVNLGFLDVTVRGRRSYGSARRPSMYALTWLPRADWTPASNRWKGITREQAKAVLASARGSSTRPAAAAAGKVRNSGHRNGYVNGSSGRDPLARDIKGRGENAAGKTGGY